jgi:alpha-L-fucosidase
MKTNDNNINEPGSQRLSIAQLRKWEEMRLGMFIHFGMSTFTGEELPSGKDPSSIYAPDQLDVDQWVSVARDAGMKYAVLTAKHTAGHCLWPTRQGDYHVGTSGNTTDVVEAFVTACEKRGIIPGLYYCCWDNHNLLGSLTPSIIASSKIEPTMSPVVWYQALAQSFVSRAYMEFQDAQINELLTNYGPLGEVWIDIPAILPQFYRRELYTRIAALQPQAVIMMNNGVGDGSNYPVENAWPSDLIAIERFLPNSLVGHKRWREIQGQNYYLPAEVCDPIGKEWFFTDEDEPRSDDELLGMYLVTVSRNANLLLDVGPDKHGLIPEKFIGALHRLRSNLDKLGL